MPELVATGSRTEQGDVRERATAQGTGLAGCRYDNTATTYSDSTIDYDGIGATDQWRASMKVIYFFADLHRGFLP